MERHTVYGLTYLQGEHAGRVEKIPPAVRILVQTRHTDAIKAVRRARPWVKALYG